MVATLHIFIKKLLLYTIRKVFIPQVKLKKKFLHTSNKYLFYFKRNYLKLRFL